MVCLNCGGARHNNEVQPAERMLPVAETFPYKALEAVAVSGFAGIPLGNRQPETWMPQSVGPRQHGQEVVGRFSGLLENPLEIGGSAKAKGSGVALTARLQSSDGRQPLAALCPACVDHKPATTGFHAHAKTVRPNALQLTRLISSLH